MPKFVVCGCEKGMKLKHDILEGFNCKCLVDGKAVAAQQAWALKKPQGKMGRIK
jgi:hypothetical protein